MTLTEPDWKEIEVWWNGFVQGQEQDLIQLEEILEELERGWVQSNAPFDRDPLAEDWTGTNPQAGPLRPNQEENWAQWLAHLIRSSDGTFSKHLFGNRFASRPNQVRRELVYHDEELHDRRADIIVEYPEHGLSIEVKIGDEHYEKTPQTAYLTEVHHHQDLDWIHYLLLPGNKQAELSAAFEDNITKSESWRSTIIASNPEERDIEVVYWQDVSQAIRKTLINGGEGSPHWAASAFVLTALIEQQIVRFYPIPTLGEYRDETFGVTDIERLESIDPGDQIDYLTAVLEGIP